MSEEERVEAYRANGYEWPPKKGSQGWPPQPVEESESFKRSRDRIEASIRRIGEYKLQWDEFFGLVQTRLMPAFTPVGFQKLKAPEHLYRKLRDAYERGIRSRIQTEGFSHKRNTKTPTELLPNFIPTNQLNDEIMEELRPMHEEWSGIPLRNGQAYGVRVYKNGSTLVNHVDRSETHVIRSQCMSDSVPM